MASTEQTTQPEQTQPLDVANDDGWLLDADSDVIPVLSVVMPTMNEEEGVAECIDRIKAAVAELEVPAEIIVSDSSNDQTPDIARERGAIVVEPDEMGYGYAYRYAFERARGDFIVMGDADTTYDFEQIPRLFEHLHETGADIVMGSRLEGEIRPGSMPPLHKHVGNPLLTKFLNVFYDAGVSDAHSGFRIVRREALETMDLTTNGMEFASEMIMEAGAKGLHIEEVPIVYHERKGEETLDSFRDGWRHVKFMLQNAPGYLFTGPALGLGLVGVTLLVASSANTTVNGVYLGMHTAMAGCLALIVGYQIGSLSVFSSLATNPIRRPQDPITRLVRERFRLQHGATLGLGLFGGGGVALGIYGWQWVASGFTQSPPLVATIVAVTVVILGVQTVFYSFFLSMLAEHRSREATTGSPASVGAPRSTNPNE